MTAPATASSSTSCAPATPWSSGDWTRLGRSLRHLVDTVTSLAERGIGLRNLQEVIDTTTPGGKLVFTCLRPSEFERDLIPHERPRGWPPPGPAAAAAAGRRC